MARETGFIAKFSFVKMRIAAMLAFKEMNQSASYSKKCEILCCNMKCFKHEMKQETEIKVRIYMGSLFSSVHVYAE